MSRHWWVGMSGLGLLLWAGAGLAAPSGGGSISGTVRAPAGQRTLQKTFVVACWAPQGPCQQKAPQTKAIVVDSRGPEAAFEVGGLVAGQYLVIALRDVNGSGGEDAGDWAGHVAAADGSPRIVQVGERVEISLSVVGQKPPAGGTPPVSGTPPAPAPAPSPMAKGPVAPGKGGLSGIYLGVKRQLVAPGPGSSVQQGITWMPQQDWITFFPDGRVYAALPPHGLAVPFDWSLCGEGFTWCPTYSVKGDDIRVTWTSGFEKRFTRQKGGALQHAGVDFVRLEPLDGLLLDGRYQSVGNEYRTGFIIFRKDGTFEDRGFARELDLAPGGRAGGTGWYVIRANMLELRYADGAVARTSVYALPGEAPRVLWFRAWDYHLHR
ncbi:hypothetical protein ACN28I_38250 [Archangium gephyra]|uniref:hypothetical protein n=1 Tax=Archangium gephyra TaxID=48 RepID=UPI003B823777